MPLIHDDVDHVGQLRVRPALLLDMSYVFRALRTQDRLGLGSVGRQGLDSRQGSAEVRLCVLRRGTVSHDGLEDDPLRVLQTEALVLRKNVTPFADALGVPAHHGQGPF